MGMDNYPFQCKTGLFSFEWKIIHSNGKIKAKKNKFSTRPLHDQNKQKRATSLVTMLSRDWAVKVSSDMSYVFRDRYCTAVISDWKIANWMIPSQFNNRFDPNHGNHGGRSLR